TDKIRTSSSCVRRGFAKRWRALGRVAKASAEFFSPGEGLHGADTSGVAHRVCGEASTSLLDSNYEPDIAEPKDRSPALGTEIPLRPRGGVRRPRQPQARSKGYCGAQ